MSVVRTGEALLSRVHNACVAAAGPRLLRPVVVLVHRAVELPVQVAVDQAVAAAEPLRRAAGSTEWERLLER